MHKHTLDAGDTFEWCPDKPQAMQFYKLLIKDLSPTQFATGRAEVMTKAQSMRKRFKKDPQKLRDFLVLRPVPVVKRGKQFYLTDHHHLVMAVYESMHERFGEDELFVYIKVVFDGTSLSEINFWKAMFDYKYVYLFDHNGGGPNPPETLPKHIKDLGFDPYRSLSWLVRSHHGYLKNDAPFSEFKWANFFRTRILLGRNILAGNTSFDSFAFKLKKSGDLRLTDEGRDILEEALFLARGPEAAGLPGYLGRG